MNNSQICFLIAFLAVNIDGSKRKLRSDNPVPVVTSKESISANRLAIKNLRALCDVMEEGLDAAEHVS